MADNVRFGGQQQGLKLVGRAGIEPATIGLKGAFASLNLQILSSLLSAIFNDTPLAITGVLKPVADRRFV